MIIRGNTVSTTIAPEKIAEQIGSIVGSVGTLIVDLNVVDSLGGVSASHTSTQIVEHINKGGNVLGVAGTTATKLILPVSGISQKPNSEPVVHFQWDAGINHTIISVDFDGGVTKVYTTRATTDDIGDISSALGEIREYAENLINGGASE